MPTETERSGERTVLLCPNCRCAVREWDPGPGGRPGARCPRCGALERHRLLALLVDRLGASVPERGVVLDVAPTRGTIPRLQLAGRAYVGLDIDPAADGRTVTVVGSLTDLPILDGAVDLAVVSHVLEHVPDDRAAMFEIRRLLSPTGRAIVQVPWREGPTDEDPGASPEDRVRRFGQADHVRLYGSDFEDRLRKAGLAVTRVSAHGLLPDRQVRMFGISPEEPVWIVEREPDRGGGPAGGDALGEPGDLAPLALPDPAGDAILDLLDRLEILSRQHELLETKYRMLRRAAPVRAMLGIRRIVTGSTAPNALRDAP